MDAILDFLIEPYRAYQSYEIALECVAALLGIASVFFAWRDKLAVFPSGIISTAIYIYLLYRWGLFGDMMINVYYFCMSIYGWYFWSKGRVDENMAPIAGIKVEQWSSLLLLFGLSFLFVMGVYYFKPYIHGSDPAEIEALLAKRYHWVDWLDSFTTAIFFVGMWLMAKKIWQHWLFWIVGDLISIPLYLYKGLGITALQYMVFTLMAIAGLMAWRKMRQKQY